MIKSMIAYCGFDCKKCIIDCNGCKSDKPTFAFCAEECEIRKCAKSKGIEVCSECENKSSCDKFKVILEYKTKNAKR